jgi:hypothetical protein
LDADENDANAHKRRAPRHSKTPSGSSAKPTQLHYYQFVDRDILIRAKDLFEVFLCTKDPFPKKATMDEYVKEAIHQATAEITSKDQGAEDEAYGASHFDCTLSFESIYTIQQ